MGSSRSGSSASEALRREERAPTSTPLCYQRSREKEKKGGAKAARRRRRLEKRSGCGCGPASGGREEAGKGKRKGVGKDGTEGLFLLISPSPFSWAASSSSSSSSVACLALAAPAAIKVMRLCSAGLSFSSAASTPPALRCSLPSHGRSGHTLPPVVVAAAAEFDCGDGRLTSEHAWNVSGGGWPSTEQEEGSLGRKLRA